MCEKSVKYVQCVMFEMRKTSPQYSRLKRISRRSESSKRNEHSELSTRNKTRDSARVHSPSAATMKTAQRAREISKLFVRHTRSKAQDSAVMHGLCRSDAVGHTKNEATSRRCLRSEQGRRTATVLCCTARFEQTQLSPQRARENQPLTAPAATPFMMYF